MWTQDTGDERIIRYLLGELNDREQTELEDDCFSNDAFFEHVSAVETELIDAYVRGELPLDARERFEQRCMKSPRQMERIDFARRLLREQRLTEAGRVRRSGWWQRNWAPPKLRRPILAIPLAVVVLVIAVSVAWWIYRPDEGESLRARQGNVEPAPGQNIPVIPKAAESPSFPATKALENVTVGLSLMPGLTRSADEGAELVVPSAATRIEIFVGFEGEDASAYRVVIRTPEGREVWRESGLKPVQPGSRKVMTTVAADRLPSGDYVLTLAAAGSSGEFEDVADYAFRIAKRQDAAGR